MAYHPICLFFHPDTNACICGKIVRDMNKKKIGLITGIIIAVLAVLAGLFFAFNEHEIVFVKEGEDPYRIEYGESYKEPGVEAYYHETLIPFLHEDLEVTIDSKKVDAEKLGTYTVSYTASFKKINGTDTRQVIVQDTKPPVITLTANPDSYTPFGKTYEEEGFKAEDNYDGDLTEKVVRTEYEDHIEYSVTDSSGNTAKETRKIVYDDRSGPDITFPEGYEEETAYVGSGWYNDYQAIDDVDGDVTDKVSVDGSVDINTPGDYTLTFTVTDSHGNTSTRNRLVHVIPRPTNTPAGEDSWTIYLTFDDGPAGNTERLLGILAKYDVKATFFTTSCYPQYAYCIGLEAQQGHTVAVHTASHNYAAVYASDDAYWADFDQQNAVVASQTGSFSSIFRFPGGSSNTVSMNYNSGIMSRLAAQAGQRGLVYFDWNVSSGDAGGTTDTSAVYQNVIAGIEGCHNAGVPSVVLQHDVHGYSVDAVEDIILWGLQNGYHFSALSPGSYAPHHRIAN